MLTTLEKILFVLLAGGSLYYGGRKIYDVYRAIARGKPDARFDRLPERIRRALWIVLTQQSVFKTRPIVSFLHALIFYGFVFYFLVNLVDVLEGFFGLHARGGAWNLFNLIADVLTASVLTGIIGMLIRRWFVRPKDFSFPDNVPVQPEVRAGIFRDSTLVAGFITFTLVADCYLKPAKPLWRAATCFNPLARRLPGYSSTPDRARWKSSITFFGGALWDRFCFLSLTFHAPNTSISFSRRSIWR